MWTTIKIVAGIVVTLAILVFAGLVESGIRSRYGGQMSIDGLPVTNASVTGTWIPDFLWTGKAWKIVIQSDEDLELSLDGRAYIIPKGFHEIYSNHDHTNTGQFVGPEFRGYPDKIEVRQLDNKP